MKQCRRCKMNLPISEFYAHPNMADGHLGKCKSCVRQAVAKRAAIKAATDLDWVLAERERQREYQRKKKKRPGFTKIPTALLHRLLYQTRHPEKFAAQRCAANAIASGKLIRKPCQVCGNKAQAHHDDYTKPLNVRWLCSKHHTEHHRILRDKAIIERFAK